MGMFIRVAAGGFLAVKRWLRGKKNASFTVEYSLIMPMVIACILLMLSINFYMHDLIIFQSLANEIVHSKELTGEDAGSYFKKQVKERAFLLEDAAYTESNGALTRKVSYVREFKLPLANLMNCVLSDPFVSLKGKAEFRNWSMSGVIRYITNKKGGD